MEREKAEENSISLQTKKDTHNSEENHKADSEAQLTPEADSVCAVNTRRCEMIEKKKILSMLKQQSQELPGEEKKGETKIRRNSIYAERLLEYENDSVRTLHELLKHSVEQFPKNECFGAREYDKEERKWREYKFLSYSQFFSKVKDFGSGLLHIGLQPQKHRIGIFSKNRLEWSIAEHACYAYSLPVVAIYDVFGEENISYIINHAELQVVVASAEAAPKLLKVVDKCEHLKYIIQMDLFDQALKTQMETKKKDLEFLSFERVVQWGKDQVRDLVPPGPDDFCMFMYTSGTTGVPKAVLISHSNAISAVAGIKASLPELLPSDAYLSYLPLPHIFERTAQFCVLSVGAKIGFYRGDSKLLVEDIQVLRPTLLAGVPRVFDRIYRTIASAVDHSNVFKRILFHLAFEKKKHAFESKENLNAEADKSTVFYNALVFNKLKKKLGINHIRAAISGAAPLGRETHEFIRVCFGCPVFQGYGLTETNASGCITDPDDHDFAHVGPPVGSVEIKLVDVPELNYFTSSTDHTGKHKMQQGEIWIRGPPVARGYFKDPKKTREDFDEDGWFHTGDIGEWRDNGTLKIIDRKKNIFKLQQGEYVAPERLEVVYGSSRFCGQLFIYGESRAPFLVAVVMPEKQFTTGWAKEHNLAIDLPALCKSKELKSAIMTDFQYIHKEQRLQPFEELKGIVIAETPNGDGWLPETGLVTPTLKIKRPQIATRYREEINAIYKELGIEINTMEAE